jgi:hypothetical protein
MSPSPLACKMSDSQTNFELGPTATKNDSEN